LSQRTSSDQIGPSQTAALRERRRRSWQAIYKSCLSEGRGVIYRLIWSAPLAEAVVSCQRLDRHSGWKVLAKKRTVIARLYHIDRSLVSPTHPCLSNKLTTHGWVGETRLTSIGVHYYSPSLLSERGLLYYCSEGQEQIPNLASVLLRTEATEVNCH
jgi:hypothetical protein